MNKGQHDATVDVSQHDSSTMITSGNAGQENATIPLITIYLIGVLTWTLFITATNIFNLLSTRVNNERTDHDDEVDYLEESYSSRGNQLLNTFPAEIESEGRVRSCNDSKNNCDDSTAVGKNRSNFDNETIIVELLKENHEHAKRKMSFHAALDKGSNSAIASAEKASNLRKVHFTLSMDRFRKRFGNDVLAVSKLISKDSKHDNCAKNVCDRENEGTTSNNEERLADECFETNIMEDTNSSVRRALTATFLTSILQENALPKSNSKEHFGQRTTPMDANVSGITHNARDENDSDIFVELEELLNRTSDDIMEPPQEEPHQSEELLGVVPENEANSTTEESLIQSSTDATQSRIEKGAEAAKEEEEVGTLPERKPLKNCHEAESTILLSRAQSTGYGKEEEDLNAMIRRMIISELKRYRKKKQMVLKRAYSDTESVMPSMKHDSKTRTGLFSHKGRTFFRDLFELEESMRKRVDSGSDTNATVYRVDRKASNPVEPAARDDVETIDGLASLGRARGSINSLGITSNLESNILLERKVNVHRLPEAPETSESGSVLTEQEETQASKSTQTEHVYVIHAIRSCPLRKGRPLLQFQLHRLATGREPASSKAVFTNLDYTRFVFRKASDNLIYERGKASGSPSYIPSPERFRWKYVMPSKAK